MSYKPIEAQYTTGRNLHVVRHHPDGRVWNQTNQAWEAYDSSNWLQYAYALTEQSGSCYYRASNNIPNLDVLTTDALYERISSVPTLPSLAGGDIPLGTGQSQGADVFSIGGSVSAANNLDLSANSIVPGAVASGTPASDHFITDLDSAETNAYLGRVLIFTSGALLNCAAIITAFNASTKRVDTTGYPAAPSIADTFVVV